MPAKANKRPLGETDKTSEEMEASGETSTKVKKSDISISELIQEIVAKVYEISMGSLNNYILGEMSPFLLDVLSGSIAGFPARDAPEKMKSKIIKDSFNASEVKRAAREIPTSNCGMRLRTGFKEATEIYRTGDLKDRKMEMMTKFALMSRWYANRKTMTAHPKRVNSAQTAKEYPEGTAAQVLAAPAIFGGVRKKTKTGSAEAAVRPVALPLIIYETGRTEPKIGDGGLPRDLLACFCCGFHDQAMMKVIDHSGSVIRGIPVDLSRNLNVVVGVYGTADQVIDGESGNDKLRIQTAQGMESIALARDFLLKGITDAVPSDPLPIFLEEIKMARMQSREPKNE